MARDDLHNVDDLYRILTEEVPDRMVIVGADVYGSPSSQIVDSTASSLMDLIEQSLPDDKPNDLHLGSSYDMRIWAKIEAASTTAEQNNRFRNGPIITRNS